MKNLLQPKFFISGILFLFITLSCRLSGSPNITDAGTIQPTPFLPQNTPTPPVPSSTPMPTPTTVPSDTPTLPPAGCYDTQGNIEESQLTTDLLPKPLVYRLYLPPCYSDKRVAKYPLLILIHGQLFHVDQWERLGAPEKADELITAGEAQPFLIAMPYEDNSLINPYQSNFGKSIAEALVPYIDSKYDTCARRECRAIGGLSRGGAWAIHIGFTYWNEFAIIGAHSVPPFLSDPNFLPLWLKNIPAGQEPVVYMDIGDTDPYLSYAKTFEALLGKYQIRHEWHLNSGTHNETYWSSHVEEYLRWYAAQWPKLTE